MIPLINKSLVFIVGNVTYDFTMMGEDDEVLCLRKMNETTWRDAFRYFHELTDGSARYSDALHNIMMELAATEDSSAIH